MSRKTFGICAYGYRAGDLLAFARAADELGFDAIWLGEHYVIPKSFQSTHPGMTDGIEHDEEDILSVDIDLPDLWTTVGAMITSTRRLKIGTAICIVPMLHPLFVARASVTAHNLSDGRFLLGVGAGWLKEEYEAYQVDFHTRGKALDEAIDVLRNAWQGGFFSHAGAKLTFGPIQITPRAVSIPLVGAGNSAPALRRVARTADAWINSAMIPIDEALRLRSELEAERQRAGTGDRPFTYYLRPPTCSDEDIAPFHANGFDNIVLWGHDIWSPDPTIPVDEKRRKLGETAARLNIT